MKHHRQARVAEAIREAASEAILFQLRDPRVKFTTVTRAEVSADLQHAKVFVSVMGSDRDRELTLHGLKSAAGFIQSKLADRMKSRFVPILEFVLDEGVRNSLEVARLLGEEKIRNEQATVPLAKSHDGIDADEDGAAHAEQTIGREAGD